MGKTNELEEKYGENYDILIKNSKQKDLFKLLLMCKNYKSQAPLNLKFETEPLKKCKKLMNNPNKKNVEEAMKIPVVENKKKGLRVPTASAFLHFLTNGKVPILDRYTYAVYKNEPVKKHQKNEVEDYMAYYDFFTKKHGKKDPKKINFKLMEDGKKICKS